MMSTYGFTLFDTAIGRCGIAWHGSLIAGVQLPESNELKTPTRFLRRCPPAREASPPLEVERAIAGIVALPPGEPSDLSLPALDLEGMPELDRRVDDGASTGAPASTVSYREASATPG